jgi:hypothetical protein
MKTWMMIGLISVAGFVQAGFAEPPEFSKGKVLFEDDFKGGSLAKEKYEEIIRGSYEGKECEVSYQDGYVQLLSPWNQLTSLRTKPEIEIKDDGSVPVLYSVQQGAASKSPVTLNRLVVRLGEKAFNRGYAIQHYYGGQNAILSIVQIYRGEKVLFQSKCPANNPEETVNEFPQLLSDNPSNVLAVRLENVTEGVKISVYFNDELLKTIIDDSPDRIAEGSGVGIQYENHVGEYRDSAGKDVKSEIFGGQFSNLKVVQATAEK